MKKFASLILAAVFAVGFVSSAQAEGLKPLAYPGSSWGTLTWPSGVKGTGEEHNAVLTGKVEQGIDWLKFGDGNRWTLNTYGSLGYSADHEGLDWNNKVVPAIGVKVSRAYEKGVVDIGVQAFRERRWKSDQDGNGVQVYASYWFGWDAKK